MRVSADGVGWITIIDRRRMAPRVRLLVVVFLAVVAVAGSIPGGLVVVRVVFGLVAAAILALGVVLIGLAISKPRGPKVKSPRIGYATQVGDLVTMPLAPNETVVTLLSIVREVLAWADRTGRTLRAEARRRSRRRRRATGTSTRSSHGPELRPQLQGRLAGDDQRPAALLRHQHHERGLSHPPTFALDEALEDEWEPENATDQWFSDTSINPAFHDASAVVDGVGSRLLKCVSARHHWTFERLRDRRRTHPKNDNSRTRRSVVEGPFRGRAWMGTTDG